MTTGRWQKCVFATALCVVVMTTFGSAPTRADDGYQPPDSLIWPLRNQDNGEPRRGVWSSFGEWQDFADRWFHSGFDPRGVYGDTVRVADGGNVWMVANIEDCNAGPTEGHSCRLYVKSTDGNYVYYYSHLYLGPESDYTSTARAKIENASPKGAASYTVNADTDVAAGDTLAYIGDFPDWNHLHFGIIAVSENYDMVNPLTAFSDRPLDDEPPTIDSLEFYEAGTPEGSSPQQVVPEGDCDVVSGDLDIVAKMEDTFYSTNPAPVDLTGGATSTGVYEARYLVRRADSATPYIDKVWYRFDRMPLSCAGPLRGTDCPTSVTEQDFFDATIDRPSGAAHWGGAYASILISAALSNSSYSTNETYASILTNSWGVDGSWDTTSTADGLYQVSVEASDHAGNKAARSRFVYVHNGAAPFDENDVDADVYVRDNLADVGALPSTLGGHPFWTSPDIIVVPQGDPTPAADSNFAGTAQVMAGTDYDVYVRVHNDRCVATQGVSAKVYSANPSMIVDETQWVELTGGGFVGDTDVPAGTKALLGPFPWAPTSIEAASNNGHRCMLAYITSSQDPHTAMPDVVSENDNIAQRNLQVESTSFDIVNPEYEEARIRIDFDGNDLPIHDQRTRAILAVKHHPALAEAWANVPGTRFHHDAASDRVLLQFEVPRVALPPVRLPARTRLPASVLLAVLPTTAGVQTYRVDFSEYVNGDLRGGMSFSVTSAGVIK